MAILGLLHESPMHGYELRKRLNLLLGSFRALSYGSLYPCLKSLVAQGWIVGADAPVGVTPALTAKRAKIVYELTADGKEHFQSILATAGPAAWEDENFDVRFAFFAQTDAETRLRILEGRRTRLTEQVETEVRWLDNLIDSERGTRRARTPGFGRPTAANPADGASAPRL